jgi:transcription elongation factor Elf1
VKEFACPKCNSADVFIKETGKQIGLYCGDCGKWIKWLGKEEQRLVERWIESRKNNQKG